MCVLSEQDDLQRAERQSDHDRASGGNFLDLQRQKANNINLVTAGHFLVQVREALILAKARGLTIPVVYNSSGYEKAEMLRLP